jgi:hypothetical protein
LTPRPTGNIVPNMEKSTHNPLTVAVLRLLRPLVRILLRNGISYGAFADLAKWVFVDVAEKEFRVSGRKQTVSRVSVLTGLTRKDVARLQAIASPDDAAEVQRHNRAARVISGWVRDTRFMDAAGNPADLPIEGEPASFTQLVKHYSGDIPVRAVLDELLRVGTVERTESGTIRLVQHAYVPRTGETGKLHILGTDVADLIASIDHNLQHAETNPYFQRKVMYDNLPEEIIPRLRKLTEAQGQALLEELDRFLSQHDRDCNPDSEGTGRKRAGVGIYYFEDDASSE